MTIETPPKVRYTFACGHTVIGTDTFSGYPLVGDNEECPKCEKYVLLIKAEVIGKVNK